MAESIVGQDVPEAKVTYYPDEGILYVENGRPFGEGETIAKNVVVFYDRENRCEVVGVCIEFGAEVVLKPFVDAILAKHEARTDTVDPVGEKESKYA